MSPDLVFVHISDSHLGPTRDFEFHGRRPYDCLERLVETINAFPTPPDFVVHTGDVSNDRSEASFELAADLLGRLHAPIYYVNGNHDDRGWLNKFLGCPLHASGDPALPLDYTFEVKGERFVVLDAFDPAVEQPAGHLRPEQIEWLCAEAAPDGPPLTVLLHYPALQMASPWLDRRMLVDNGDALHAALLPARHRLRGVFHGHLHRSCQVMRDGITYTCAPSSTGGYAWRLWDEKPEIDYDYPPAYSIVIYSGAEVVVHQYAF